MDSVRRTPQQAGFGSGFHFDTQAQPHTNAFAPDPGTPARFQFGSPAPQQLHQQPSLQQQNTPVPRGGGLIPSLLFAETQARSNPKPKTAPKIDLSFNQSFAANEHTAEDDESRVAFPSRFLPS